MAKEVRFLKYDEVHGCLSGFRAGLEEHFFSLKLKDPEDHPKYLKDLTFALEAIEKRLNNLKPVSIWCE